MYAVRAKKNFPNVAAEWAYLSSKRWNVKHHGSIAMFWNAALERQILRLCCMAGWNIHSLQAFRYAVQSALWKYRTETLGQISFLIQKQGPKLQYVSLTP